jgi:hypothetical protein
LSPTKDDPEEGKPKGEEGAPTHLKPLRVRGSIGIWSVLGAVGCAVGLLALTGLASSPWLFLLYPLLIVGQIVSLGVLALTLLRRL